VDQGDCVSHCVQRILQQNNREDVVIHLDSYEQLLVSLQSRDYLGGKPVILMGEVRSEQHIHKFSLFDEFATIAHIPILMVGCAIKGWIIRRFLDSPNVCGYLHNEDHWEICLVEAINRVRRRTKYLSPTAEGLVNYARRHNVRRRRFDKPELVTLTGLRQDMAPCEIADQSGLDRRTVYDAMERLRHLFGTKQTPSMLAAAEKSGIYCYRSDGD
jgi:hypothetical protein